MDEKGLFFMISGIFLLIVELLVVKSGAQSFDLGIGILSFSIGFMAMLGKKEIWGEKAFGRVCNILVL